MSNKKLIIIGGGAAGFFCAVNAARMNPSLDVTIIEKSSKLLSKVKVSGGGRCNVTHSCFSIADMIKKYPRGDSFLKKAFHHFFTTDELVIGNILPSSSAFNGTPLSSNHCIVSVVKK